MHSKCSASWRCFCRRTRPRNSLGTRCRRESKAFLCFWKTCKQTGTCFAKESGRNLGVRLHRLLSAATFWVRLSEHWP